MNWKLGSELEWMAGLLREAADMCDQAAAELENWRALAAGQPNAEPPIEEGDRAND